ncbi:MAG: hypothetical protein VX899_21045 [Myxococcota bacterium]|nr:hypothetical protein [Myxococcota bacterium]
MQLKIQGLRSSDALSLSIMCQDVVRQPLVEIHPETVCDLLQLSVTEGLEAQMRQDLSRFAPQMLREMGDLPDSMLPAFLKELGKVPAENIPQSVRDAITARSEGSKHPEVVKAWGALKSHLDSAEVEEIQLGGAAKHVSVHTYDVPDSHKAPDERSHKQRRRRKSAAGGDDEQEASSSKRGSDESTSSYNARMRNPKRVRDPEREVWLRKAILARLSEAQGGIKQTLLVAGMVRRSPWPDLSPEEVVSALRGLGKEGRARLSVGRWKKA